MGAALSHGGLLLRAGPGDWWRLRECGHRYRTSPAKVRGQDYAAAPRICTAWNTERSERLRRNYAVSDRKSRQLGSRVEAEHFAQPVLVKLDGFLRDVQT